MLPLSGDEAKFVVMLAVQWQWCSRQPGPMIWEPLPRVIGKSKRKQYREYMDAVEEGKQWRQKVAVKIFLNGGKVGLPKEISDKILDAMAVECFHGPQEWSSWSEMTAAIRKMLRPLKDVVSYPQDNAGALVDNSDTFFCEFEAEVAHTNVLPNVIFRVSDPRFKLPTSHPYPTGFQEHLGRILHLEIVLHISTSTEGCETYNVELFRLQDNIAALKTWFPQLNSARIVIDHRKDGRMRARLRDGGMTSVMTTMPEELKKLIAEYRKVDIKKRYFLYHRQGGWEGNTPTLPYGQKYPEMDVMTAALDDVMTAVLQCEVIRL